jgi:hypothetical protein
VDRKPDFVVYLDPSQIDTIQQGVYRIWTKWELQSPRPGPDRKPVDRWLTHTNIDCLRLRVQNVEFVFYLGDMLQSTATIPEPQRQWASAPPQSVVETVITRGCVIALGVFAAVAAAQEDQSVKLLGRWRSVDTSRGGIGSMLTFQREGLVDYSPGAIVEGSYRVEGNQLVLPPGTTDGPEQRQTMTWLGNDRLRLGLAEGQPGIELARKGSQSDSVSPIIGEWSGVRDMRGNRVEVTYLFNSDSRVLLLIPFLTQRGTYSLDDGKIHLALPSRPAVDATFKVEGEVLTLTTDGQSTTYTRWASQASAQGLEVLVRCEADMSPLRPSATHIEITRQPQGTLQSQINGTVSNQDVKTGEYQIRDNLNLRTDPYSREAEDLNPAEVALMHLQSLMEAEGGPLMKIPFDLKLVRRMRIYDLQGSEDKWGGTVLLEAYDKDAKLLGRVFRSMLASPCS